MEAVALARERISAGVAVARIARDLGIRPRTLALWLRRAPVPKFRAVRVRRDPAGVPAPAVLPNAVSGALVVFAGGVRIEGLDLDGVVRLVRALA